MIRRLAVLTLVLLLRLPAGAQAVDGTSLEVHTVPDGATVVLDHVIVGPAPLRMVPVAPGRHSLRVSAGEDYKPFVETVYLEEGQALRLDLKLEPVTDRLLRDGVAALREGRTDEARDLLERSVQGTPVQSEAWWWLGLIHHDRGEDEAALEAFRRYADFFPERPELYLYLGALHERRGDASSAVTAYKLALLKTPGLSGALDGAAAATWTAIQQAGTPTEPADQLRLARLYEQKGRMEEALRWLKAAVGTVFGDWEKGDRAE